MRHSGRPLGELLISRGLISEEQLQEALLQQKASGKKLGHILVELKLLRERVLTDVLAEQLGLPLVDLSRTEIDPEVVALLSEEDARRLSALPTHRDDTRIEVAVADPLFENLDTQLIELLGSLVRIKLAVRSDLEQALDRSYAPSADLGDALRMFEARLEERKAAQAPDTVVQSVVDENTPIVKIVNVILEQAVHDRASDVHIEPMADSVRVRVRTDGALHQITTLPGPMGPSLVSRIKVMSDMNIVERRRPQDGQMAIMVNGRELDVRVSTMPTAFGEKCVMRILDKTRAVIELPALGMSAETYERYHDMIRSPYGMVISAGPTGSGKTTTLYATLTAINNDEINVVTIEDPVEYVFPTINQIQINEPAGLTFATGLRSVLRQDPDAILVGEIRDVETARIATQAALTGHFVVSSLHATDATSALAPLHGHGHRVVPDRLVPARCGRATARAPRVRALHRAVHAHRGRAVLLPAWRWQPRQGRLPRGCGLQLLRPHRLLRPARHLRGLVRHGPDEGTDRYRRAARAAAGARDRAGHDDVARPGHPAGDREREHRRRSPAHRVRAVTL